MRIYEGLDDEAKMSGMASVVSYQFRPGNGKYPYLSWNIFQGADEILI